MSTYTIPECSVPEKFFPVLGVSCEERPYFFSLSFCKVGRVGFDDSEESDELVDVISCLLASIEIGKVLVVIVSCNVVSESVEKNRLYCVSEWEKRYRIHICEERQLCFM